VAQLIGLAIRAVILARRRQAKVRLGVAMAVDFGASQVYVSLPGRGIVLREPSLVAVDESTGEVRAFGSYAEELLAQPDCGLAARRPLDHGFVAGLALSEGMLRLMIRKLQSPEAQPRVLVCVPPGLTAEQTLAVKQACVSAGAREGAVIEAPIATAIACGMAVDVADGCMVVDIGAPSTRVAVISDSRIVVRRSIGVGGDAHDEAIVAYVEREHDLRIDRREAERVKCEVGSALALEEELRTEIRERDGAAHTAKAVVLSSEELRELLDPLVAQIIGEVKAALDETPAELLTGIGEREIRLVGRGSLLRRLAERVAEETQTPCRLVEYPMGVPALGAGITLEP
jgi:rod shape-determining protein MreB